MSKRVFDFGKERKERENIKHLPNLFLREGFAIALAFHL